VRLSAYASSTHTLHHPSAFQYQESPLLDKMYII
jgi:hypothetical protein